MIKVRRFNFNCQKPNKGDFELFGLCVCICSYLMSCENDPDEKCSFIVKARLNENTASHSESSMITSDFLLLNRSAPSTSSSLRPLCFYIPGMSALFLFVARPLVVVGLPAGPALHSGTKLDLSSTTSPKNTKLSFLYCAAVNDAC